LEQWLENWRGAVVVALAVATGCLLLAIDPGRDASVSASQTAAATTVPASPASTTRPGAATTTRAGAATATTVRGATTTTAARSTASSTVPAASTTTVARAEIKQGSKGSDVTALQQRLTALGYNPGTADGTFGPSTTAAVMAFQKAAGLTADGVVGATTWAALNAAH
jgi:murein L,D-transpeptidase YcbB/YkuD